MGFLAQNDSVAKNQVALRSNQAQAAQGYAGYGVPTQSDILIGHLNDIGSGKSNLAYKDQLQAVKQAKDSGMITQQQHDQLFKAAYAASMNQFNKSHQPSTFDKILTGAKGVWDNTGGAMINAAGNTLGNAYSTVNSVVKQNDYHNAVTAANAQNNYIDSLVKAGKMSQQQASFHKAATMQKLNATAGQASQATKNLSQINPRQAAADAAETALNVGTLGVGGSILKGVEVVAKPAIEGGMKILANSGAKYIAKKVGANAAEGALIGGGNSAAETARDPNAKPIDYLKNIGMGAGAGAVLGGGGSATGQGIKAILSRGAQDRLDTLHSTPVSPDLTPEQVKSFTPQKIRVDGNPDGGTPIGIKSPLKVGVKDVSATHNVEVKTPNVMTPQEYATEFGKINKSYDQATKYLHTMSPMKQKVMQAAIDTRHQTLLNKLDDAYHNPQVADGSSKVTRVEQKTTPAPKNTGGTPSGFVNTDNKASVNDTAQTASSKAALPKGGTAVISIKKADGSKTYIPLNDDKAVQDAYSKIDQSQHGIAGEKTSDGNTYHITARTPASMESKTFGFKAETDPSILNKFGKDTMPQDTSSAPSKSKTLTSESRTSGGATKAEQRAISNELATHFDNKATYKGLSYKDETAKATTLVHENPQKAMDIAMGRTSGDNAVHEVAVAKAVEQKALKDGDIHTLQQLALSDRHTQTSEAAQRLGAEGYKMDSFSPVDVMKKIISDRRAAAEKVTGDLKGTVAKETKTIKAKVKAPSKQDWGMFIESIKC